MRNKKLLLTAILLAVTSCTDNRIHPNTGDDNNNNNGKTDQEVNPLKETADKIDNYIDNYTLPEKLYVKYTTRKFTLYSSYYGSGTFDDSYKCFETSIDEKNNIVYKHETVVGNSAFFADTYYCIGDFKCGSKAIYSYHTDSDGNEFYDWTVLDRGQNLINLYFNGYDETRWFIGEISKNYYLNSRIKELVNYYPDEGDEFAIIESSYDTNNMNLSWDYKIKENTDTWYSGLSTHEEEYKIVYEGGLAKSLLKNVYLENYSYLSKEGYKTSDYDSYEFQYDHTVNIDQAVINKLNKYVEDFTAPIEGENSIPDEGFYNTAKAISESRKADTLPDKIFSRRVKTDTSLHSDTELNGRTLVYESYVNNEQNIGYEFEYNLDDKTQYKFEYFYFDKAKNILCHYMFDNTGWSQSGYRQFELNDNYKTFQEYIVFELNDYDWHVEQLSKGFKYIWESEEGEEYEKYPRTGDMFAAFDTSYDPDTLNLSWRSREYNLMFEDDSVPTYSLLEFEFENGLLTHARNESYRPYKSAMILDKEVDEFDIEYNVDKPIDERYVNLLLNISRNA